MRVNKWLLPILALVLILGTVGIAQAAGLWVVSGREMVDLAQLTSGDEVKGWMTLQQVADGTGIETAVLLAKLGLPADLPPETVLKDIEGIVEGFEITAVRTVVDEALGLAPGAEEATTQETGAAKLEAAASPVPMATPATAPTAEAKSEAAEPTAAATPAAVHEPTGTEQVLGRVQVTAKISRRSPAQTRSRAATRCSRSWTARVWTWRRCSRRCSFLPARTRRRQSGSWCRVGKLARWTKCARPWASCSNLFMLWRRSVVDRDLSVGDVVTFSRSLHPTTIDNANVHLAVVRNAKIKCVTRTGRRICFR